MADAPAPTPTRPPQRGKRRRSWFTRVVWWRLLILVLVALAGGWFAVCRSPLTARLILPSVSAALGVPVEADRVVVTLAAGVRVEGLRVVAPGFAPPSADAPSPAEGVLLSARTARVSLDHSDLFRGRVTLDELDFDHAIVRLSQSLQTGRMNIAGLRPPTGSAAAPAQLRLPVVRIRNSAVEIGEHGRGGFMLVRRIPVEGELTPRPDASGSAFRLVQTGPISGPDGLVGPTPQMPVEFVGTVGPDGLTARALGVALADWPADVVPTRMREAYRRLGLDGAIDGATLTISPEGEMSARVDVQGVAVALPFDAEGNLAASDTPLKLRNTTGSVVVTPAGLRAELTGDLNELTYTVLLETQGLEATSPFRCELGTSFRLGPQMELLVFAPPFAIEKLDLFGNPTADMLATIRLLRDPPTDAQAAAGEPGTLHVKGELVFSNGNATFQDFPYPVQEIAGIASFDESTLELTRLTGRTASGATLRARGVFSPIGAEAEADLTIEVDDLPIDTTLRGALDEDWRTLLDELVSEPRVAELEADGLYRTPAERAPLESQRRAAEAELAAWPAGGIATAQRRAIEDRIAELDAQLAVPAFEPGGLGQVVITIHRAYGHESIWTTTIDASIPRLGLVPDHFPLPLVGENLRLLVTDDEASLTGGVYRGLTGGVAHLDAFVRLTDDAGNDLEHPPVAIDIRADAVPIDERFIRAIPGYREAEANEPGTVRWLLDRLRPTGAIDCVAEIRSDEAGELTYQVETILDDLAALPLPFPAGAGSRAASRLELRGLEGTLVVREDLLVADLAGGLLDRSSAAQLATPFVFFTQLDFGEAGVEGAGEPVAGAMGPTPPGPALWAEATLRGVDPASPLADAAAVFSRQAARTLDDLQRARRPSGSLDVRAQLAGFLDGSVTPTVTLSRIARLAFDHEGDRLELLSAGGEIRVVGDPAPRVVLDGLDARLSFGGDDAGQLRASGWLPMGFDPALTPRSAGVALTLSDARFDSALARQLAFRAGRAVGEAFAQRSVRGAFDLDVRIEPETPSAAVTIADADDMLGPLRMSGSLRPRSLRLDGPRGPVDIPLMDGRISFEPGRAWLHDLTADAGDWRASADGSIITGSDGALAFSAAIDLTSRGLPESLLSLLPGAVARTLGTIDLRTDRPVRVPDLLVSLGRERTGAALTGEVSGTASLDVASADVGVSITELTGRVAFRAAGDFDADWLPFEVSIDADRLRASGLRLTGLHARAVAPASDPGLIVVDRLWADSHGGRLAGEVTLARAGDAASEQTEYWASIQLAGVRAAPALADLGAGEAPAISADPGATLATPEAVDALRREQQRVWNGERDFSRGLMDASITAGGVVGDLATRTGRGEVRISGGKVVELPGLLPLIEVSNLQPPAGDTLSSATAMFFLDGPTLTFEQISAVSNAIELFGYGTMTLPGNRLDLRFNSRALRPVPILGDLLAGVRDELVSTRVRGSPGSLDVTTEPFTGTKRFLGDLFGGKRTEQERRLAEIEARVRGGRDRVRRDAQREADRAAMPEATPQTLAPGGAPGEAPTLVIQPTDD